MIRPALCILQIGELVGKPADSFRAQNPAIPWRQIKAARNMAARGYGTVDSEATWEIICKDTENFFQQTLQSIRNQQDGGENFPKPSC